LKCSAFVTEFWLQPTPNSVYTPAVEQLKIEEPTGYPPEVRVLKLSEPFLMTSVFEFQSIVRDSPKPVTIVDLTDVPYMDSAALGAVMGLHISSQRLKHKYAVVGPSPRLQTLFEVSGVRDLLIVFPTIDEALKALL
jgi:anti-anti-sigma factor